MIFKDEPAVKVMFLPQPAGINPDLLHEELQALLSAKYDSLDTGFAMWTIMRTYGQNVPKEISQLKPNDLVLIVRAKAEATEADSAAVEAAVKAHDGTKLSQNQQKVAARDAAYQRLKTLDVKGELADKAAPQQMTRLLEIIDDIQKVMIRYG
jgi:hypothetical protein